MAVQNRSGVSHSDSRTIAAAVCIAKMYCTVFKIRAIEIARGTTDVPKRFIIQLHPLFTVTEVNARLFFCVPGM